MTGLDRSIRNLDAEGYAGPLWGFYRDPAEDVLQCWWPGQTKETFFKLGFLTSAASALWADRRQDKDGCISLLTHAEMVKHLLTGDGERSACIDVSTWQVVHVPFMTPLNMSVWERSVWERWSSRGLGSSAQPEVRATRAGRPWRGRAGAPRP